MKQYQILDFLNEKVPTEYRASFLQTLTKYDNDMSLDSFYDTDMLERFLDNAKEEN